MVSQWLAFSDHECLPGRARASTAARPRTATGSARQALELTIDSATTQANSNSVMDSSMALVRKYITTASIAWHRVSAFGLRARYPRRHAARRGRQAHE